LHREFTVVVSCEHAGNIIPDDFAALFRGRKRMLHGHRGYDAGALELAVFIAGRFQTLPYASLVTRLLVDLNRSSGNPRRFSEISRQLTRAEREDVMDSYYWPYRREVESRIASLCGEGRSVLHLSVHTFTPALNGQVRSADIGLLYDTSRGRESLFCSRWKSKMAGGNHILKVRFNYPYSGRSDGLTTHLRRLFGEDVYLGIELEVNQKYVCGRRTAWRKIQRALVESLAAILEAYKVPDNWTSSTKPLQASRERR
jgi:predicted N-formylglutamate amidohydrolase